MAFFKHLFSALSEAVKAGSDFNPALAEVMDKLEKLHAQGHLDQVVFAAEQAYEQEHAAYTAKGIHTNAWDSQNDVAALKHFMDALEQCKGNLDPSVAPEVEHLLTMRNAMEHILSNALKK